MYDSKPNWQGITIPGLEGIQKGGVTTNMLGLGDSTQAATGTAPWSTPTGPDTGMFDLSGIIAWIQANPWILIVGIGIAWAMFSGSGSDKDPFKEYEYDDKPTPRRKR